MTFRRFLLASTLSFALPLSAQFTKDPMVIGWVDQGPRTLGAVHVQSLTTSCPKAQFFTSALNGGVVFTAGGTAYDPVTQSVWITNGTEVQQIRLSDKKVLCKFKAMLMDSKAVVSGLAVGRGGTRLIQLETRAGYAGLRSYSLRSCPPIPLRDGCKLSFLGRSEYAAGLAYDPVRDLVLYTVTKPFGTISINTLYVAKDSARCKPICKQPLPFCGPPLLGTDVLGLAYDACQGKLYATFGGKTGVYDMPDPSRCALKLRHCCNKGFGLWFKGLAVLPGWRQFPFGSGCVGKGCPFCNKIRLRLTGGDPFPGNSRFGITVEFAPVRSYGLLLLAPGRCTKGVGYPFLCGAIFPVMGPTTLVIPYGFLQGKGQCLASGTMPLPIPKDPKLCGLTLCSQALAICGVGSGIGLTQGIEFTTTK